MPPQIDFSAVEDLPADAEVVIEGEKPRGTWEELKRMERGRLGTIHLKNSDDYFALRAVPAQPVAGAPSK